MSSAIYRSALDRLRTRLAEPEIRLGSGFFIAIASVLVALALRFLLGSLVDEAQFVTLFPAVVLTVLLGGVRSGLIAVVLSAVAWWLFFGASAPGPAMAQVAPLALFVIMS